MKRAEQGPNNPLPGDHIFVPRSSNYSHHGIYVGQEKVIHYQTPMENGNPDPSVCRVVKSDLHSFLGPNTEWYIYRYGVSTQELQTNRYPRETYTTRPSADQEIVLGRAHRSLDDGFGHFNIVGNNSEDFATYCKTGQRSMESSQFSSALESVAAAREAVALGYKSPLVYAGCVMGWFSARDLKLSAGSRPSHMIAEEEANGNVDMYHYHTNNISSNSNMMKGEIVRNARDLEKCLTESSTKDCDVEKSATETETESDCNARSLLETAV